jgi:hypothetical protein
MIQFVEKLATTSVCPGCQGKGKFLVALNCQSADRECSVVCHCRDCSSSFVVSQSDTSQLEAQSLVMHCSIDTKICELIAAA